jgi:hypothetical protein
MQRKSYNKVIENFGDSSVGLNGGLINVNMNIDSSIELDDTFWRHYEEWLDEFLVECFELETRSEVYNEKEWKYKNSELYCPICNSCDVQTEFRDFICNACNTKF